VQGRGRVRGGSETEGSDVAQVSDEDLPPSQITAPISELGLRLGLGLGLQLLLRGYGDSYSDGRDDSGPEHPPQPSCKNMPLSPHLWRLLMLQGLPQTLNSACHMEVSTRHTLTLPHTLQFPLKRDVVRHDESGRHRLARQLSPQPAYRKSMELG
jgi:hypothetical protein